MTTDGHPVVVLTLSQKSFAGGKISWYVPPVTLNMDPDGIPSLDNTLLEKNSSEESVVAYGAITSRAH